MRTIAAGLFISLDGVVEFPERWGFQYLDNDMSEEIVAGIARADAVLLGPKRSLVRRCSQQALRARPRRGRGATSGRIGSWLLLLHAWRRGRKNVVHGGSGVAWSREHGPQGTNGTGAKPESTCTARRLAIGASRLAVSHGSTKRGFATSPFLPNQYSLADQSAEAGHCGTFLNGPRQPLWRIAGEFCGVLDEMGLICVPEVVGDVRQPLELSGFHQPNCLLKTPDPEVGAGRDACGPGKPPLELSFGYIQVFDQSAHFDGFGAAMYQPQTLSYERIVLP